MSALEAIDHRAIDWSNVCTTSYVIHQRFRYEYAGPVQDVRQQLIVIPPKRHGDQRLLSHRVEVSAPIADRRHSIDAFGNFVLSLNLAHVEESVDFTAAIEVERSRSPHPEHPVTSARSVAPWRAISRLTEPGDALRAAAAELARDRPTPSELAARINAWTFQHMTYVPGVTGVRTTAEEAFALGQGVCQDYAHIMIALCRLCDLPARYVSGHLLGEGGTHAWVEVMLPHPVRPHRAIARAFDPTHGCEIDFRYLTIAVGRDYLDVAPTSGTYVAPFSGVLSTSKRAQVSSVTYLD